MDELTRQVGRARRRLGIQRFTAALGWCLGVALLASAVPVGLGQYLSWPIPAWIWIAAAAALGLASALVWAFASGRGALDAAIEIDRRFTLRERVSSALALEPEQRETESGRALLADAVAHVRRIDVSGRFAVRPGRSLLLPLLPAVLLALLVWLVHPPAPDSTLQAASDAIAQVEQVRKSVDPLERKLAQQREEAKKLGLLDAEELFKKLEQGAQAMSRGELERKEAQIKLKNLADAIQARRDQLGNVDQVRQQLNQVKDVAKGPAEQLAKAVAKGDFAKALDELDKLREALNQEKLTAQEKQDLAKQLQQVQDRINDMAKTHRDAQKALQEQIDKLAQAGRQGDADQLQQQLDKLLEQMPRINQLQGLAQQMGHCAKCLNQGQIQDAQQALQGMAGQLQDLKKQLDEMGMLDDALAQLDLAQQQMTCAGCDGAGCQACQGGGDDRQGMGNGLGKGQGAGDRPERKTDTKSYDSQVRQKVGAGSGTITGTVHGPNLKGRVMQEIQSQTSAVRQGDVDPLAEQKMPRQQRDHAREYFDKFRKGE